MDLENLQKKLIEVIREANPKDVEEAEITWQAVFLTLLSIDGLMSAGQVTDTLSEDSLTYDALAKGYSGLHWLTHPALQYNDDDKQDVYCFESVLTAMVALTVRRDAYDPFSAEQIKDMIVKMTGAIASVVTLLVVTRAKEMPIEKKRAIGTGIASGLSAALNRELAMYDKALGELN